MRAVSDLLFTFGVLATGACGADAKPLELAQGATGGSAEAAAPVVMRPDPTSACIAGNPPGAVFDVGDGYEIASPAPEPGAPMPAQPTAAERLASISEQCQKDGGSGCDAAQFISKQAAECIARATGFEVGVRPWRYSLIYHSGLKRVVWRVMNVESVSSDGSSGEILTIDGTQGAVLDRGGYRFIS